MVFGDEGADCTTQVLPRTPIRGNSPIASGVSGGAGDVATGVATAGDSAERPGCLSLIHI